ncbi:DJ-1/PfpI family protein [Candidatus Micrarchaeota archaeon]|nr:DJ-1/PfpI family protein [Candidatus Micrarchaeota archaeon]MBU2477242.1 DJ-1/PfpI family protein [Candidatus Micrarchaeota archaeon]
MKVVFVIAKSNFRDEELFHTKEELEAKGIQTVIASIEKGPCLGSRGETAKAELSLDEINSEEFDGIIFVGGGGAQIYFRNQTALNLAKKFSSEKKIVGAICIAPSILANAGLLKGKKATSFPSEETNLKNKGAVYTGKPVESDGKIITANGPGAAREFGKRIAELLAQNFN